GGGGVPVGSRTVRGGAVWCVRCGSLFGRGCLRWGGFWIVQAVCSLLSLPAALLPRSLASWVRWAHEVRAHPAGEKGKGCLGQYTATCRRSPRGKLLT